MRRVGRVGALMLIAGLAVAWSIWLRPVALGGQASWLIVRGDSMEPTYVTGDLVIVRAEPSYLPGDIVAYRVPDGELGAGRVVIHRIIGGDAGAGYRLQGDNNDGVDPWTPADGDVVGRAWLRVPVVGRVLAWAHQPVTLASLAAALMVGWLVAGSGTRPAVTAPRERRTRSA